jgi:hypothetical protein
MPKHGVLRRKPALRPKGRGEQGQQKVERREHGSLTIGDLLIESTRTTFLVHPARWKDNGHMASVQPAKLTRNPAVD